MLNEEQFSRKIYILHDRIFIAIYENVYVQCSLEL